MDPVEPAGLPLAVERGPHEGFLGALLQALMMAFFRIKNRLNGVLPKDGTEAMDAQLNFSTFPVKPPTYTVATRPTASSWEGGIIYVSDGGGGAVFQGSNGSAWVNLG